MQPTKQTTIAHFATELILARARQICAMGCAKKRAALASLFGFKNKRQEEEEATAARRQQQHAAAAPQQR